MQVIVPTIAIIKNSIAAPEPFPSPKAFTKKLPASWDAIKGSKTLSTRNPPEKITDGDRKKLEGVPC